MFETLKKSEIFGPALPRLNISTYAGTRVVTVMQVHILLVNNCTSKLFRASSSRWRLIVFTPTRLKYVELEFAFSKFRRVTPHVKTLSSDCTFTRLSALDFSHPELHPDFQQTSRKKHALGSSYFSDFALAQ